MSVRERSERTDIEYEARTISQCGPQSLQFSTAAPLVSTVRPPGTTTQVLGSGGQSVTQPEDRLSTVAFVRVPSESTRPRQAYAHPSKSTRSKNGFSSRWYRSSVGADKTCGSTTGPYSIILLSPARGESESIGSDRRESMFVATHSDSQSPENTKSLDGRTVKVKQSITQGTARFAFRVVVSSHLF